MSQKPKQLDLSKPKTGPVAMRLVPELLELAKKAAADDHRTFTQLVEMLLVEHLRAKGYIK